MITEDYVSFETAKLLKEKGFPQEYNIYHSLVYNEEDYEDEYEVQRMILETRLVKAGTLSSYPVGVPEPKCYCPTLQMAMKWLREKHNLFIQVTIVPHTTITMEQKYFLFSIHKDRRRLAFKKDFPSECYFSYEQACEEAIKYCLENLI